MTSPGGHPQEWHHSIEILAQAEMTNGERVSALVDCCKQFGLSVMEAISELQAIGRADVAYQSVEALLEAYPDNTEVKRNAAYFFCDVLAFTKAGPLAQELLEITPDDPDLYYMLAYAFKHTGERDKVLSVLKEGRAKCSHPIFYQAAALSGPPDDIRTAALHDISHDDDRAPSKTEDDTTASATGPLITETLNGQEIGTTAATLSGSVAHTSCGGEYAFQYGESADNLNHRTPWQAVPPDTFSEVRDTTLSTFSSWLCYGSSHEYNVDPCSITSQWPFGIDRNHLAGIGQITLLYGWCPSSLPRARTPEPSRMHNIDLRGGTISFKARHQDFTPSQGTLTLGLGSHLLKDDFPSSSTRPWIASQWMMTGKPIALASCEPNEWSDISVDIDANPEAWSYGANNPAEQGNSDRYAYLPLSRIVGAHNGYVAMCLMYGDDREIPEGEISLREGRVRYRDWSMLRNGNGAELISFPGDSRDDALKLTNGQYRTHSDGWHRLTGNDFSPNKFIWALPQNNQVDGVVLIQHPRYPLRLAQVYLRNGGPDEKVVHAGMINLPDLDTNTPKRTLITIPENIEATHLEVNLMQGQDPKGVGLLGVEVFGDFSPKQTASAPVVVCADAKNVTPGAKLHFRIVYRDKTGTTEGNIQTLQIPGDSRPQLHTIKLMEGDDPAWLVHGNPMGFNTELNVSLDGESIQTVPFGEGTYRRHIVVQITPAQYKTGKTLEILATNEHGTSSPLCIMLD